jgi:hypothetical protein
MAASGLRLEKHTTNDYGNLSRASKTVDIKLELEAAFDFLLAATN